jgi:diguanylate cyclase (GGDEF)-like protein
MPAAFEKSVKEILRSKGPIEERLRRFADETSSFLGGGVTSVLLLDRDTRDFYLRSTTLRVPPSVEFLHYPALGTIEEMALQEKRVVSLSEVHRAPGSRLRGDMIFFPLVSSEEPLGVLVVQLVSQGGISPGKAEALEEGAALLADAVGASLREESTALRMTKIAAINEAGVNIISTLDLTRLLKLVTTSACLIMEAESCVVRLLDGQTGKYTIREYYGMQTDGDQKELFRLDKKAVTDVLKGASSVLVRNVSEEKGWEGFAGVARTLMCLPLRGDGEVLGTLTVFDKFPQKTFYPSSFTADDLGTFERYVLYAEKAVSNAIAFERNERLKNLDESTGLPTLKYFQSRLLHELSRARRFKRRLVLMICEVSPRLPGKDFSAIDPGEYVVKRLAGTMRGALREYDIVSRISDWKFGMILPEAEDGKMSAIPRIKKAVNQEVEEIRKRIGDLKVDVRFGHAAYPEDGDDYEKLIFKSNVLRM